MNSPVQDPAGGSAPTRANASAGSPGAGEESRGGLVGSNDRRPEARGERLENCSTDSSDMDSLPGPGGGVRNGASGSATGFGGGGESGGDESFDDEEEQRGVVKKLRWRTEVGLLG